MAKPIDNPDHISLLIPTRARPHRLQTLFESLEENTQDKNLIDVWLYVDDDDLVTQEFIETHRSDRHGFKVYWVIRGQTKTGGQMVNVLWQQCTTNAGIYFPTTDDLLFTTQKWDGVVRQAFNQFPDRILMAYPDEATANPGQVTIAILSAEWINITGRMFTSYFPFWFDDTWVDHVAQMIQRKAKLDIHMDPQGGRGQTTRMRNLSFWGRFFSNTLDERIAEASLLRKAIYNDSLPAYQKSLEEGQRLAQRFEADGEKIDDAAIAYAERKFGGEFARSKPSAKYLAVEAEAVNHLFRKAKIQFSQGRFEEALTILDNIRYATCKFQNLERVYALCNEALGRHGDAHRAELAEQAIGSAMSATAPGIWSDDVQLIPTGENLATIQPQLDKLSELRIFFMPVTLRVNLIRGLLENQPLREWLPSLREFWARYRRRHAS